MKSPPVPPQQQTAEAGGWEEAPARTRVRKLLIEPLAEKGLNRANGATVEQHAAMTERLVRRLAYMSPEGLRMLEEQVEQLAEGKRRDRWPAEVTVVNLARRIERPPAAESRIVPSYMRSAAGRRAWEEDPLLAAELLRHLLSTRLPPADWQWAKMREAAEYRRRRIAGARMRREEGRETEEDARRLDEWAREREQVRAWVFDGKGQESSDAAGVSDAA